MEAFISAILIALLVVININSQGFKPNYQMCSHNLECASRNCKQNICLPLRCRRDKECLLAGLSDHYCKRTGYFLKLFASECVPKRGPRQKCKRNAQCLSNRCISIIRRCT